MFRQELKVPKDRTGVIIGKSGETKKRIEQTKHVTLKINSKTGEVLIEGEDSLDVYDAKIIVSAIARGFSPANAFKLFNEDYVFELVYITDFAGKSKKSLERVKARIIGTKGRARENLEQKTETAITIYGKTVGIIGQAENVAIARKAVEAILDGSPHSNVYRWLDKKRKELEKARILEHAARID